MIGYCNLQSIKNFTAITYELCYNPQKLAREAPRGQTICPSSHSKCRAQIANFLCDRQDSTYLKLYGPYILCHNYSTLFYCEKQHRQQVNRRLGCVPIKLY